MAIITLTTDFWVDKDHFVGAIKGAISARIAEC